MKKATYKINGLDCPHCASRVEKGLKADNRIEDVSINLVTQSLMVTFKGKEVPYKELNKMVNNAKDGANIEYFDDEENDKRLINGDMFILLMRIFLAALIVIVGVFFITPLTKEQYNQTIPTNMYLLIGLYAVGYILIAYDYVFKFIISFRHPKQMLNETTLMIVASVAAFALSHYYEAILVMVFFQIGNFIEQLSLRKSKNIIKETIDKREEFASIYDHHNHVIKIKACNIKVDDVIALKVGDIIPVDGVVVNGNAELDTSSVTGEFALEQISEGSKVYSGTSVKNGSVDIKATSTYDNSTTNKILNLVLESNEHKSKAEKFITKFATWYTPIVMIVSLLIMVIPSLIISLANGFVWATWEKWILIGLTVLVTSCPCALIVSVPLTYFMGTTLAFKKGIIIKGANYLERLNDVKTVVSDKTGTLTSGNFKVTSINIKDIKEEEFLEYLYVLESRSSHPIAVAIKDAIEVSFALEIPTNYKEIVSKGVKCEYKNHQLMIGNKTLLKEENIDFKTADVNELTLYVVVDNTYAGYITLDDSIKDESKEAIKLLKEDNIKVVLLTGGKEVDAKKVSDELGISEYKASLLPEEKLEYIKEEINKKEGAVLYVGDGINDTPCIALADVGVSMGKIGASSTVNESDIVILNDDPLKLVEAKQIAKKTRNRTIFNIVFALLVKVIVTVLAILSIVDIWVAVLADTGLLIVLIISSILLLKSKIDIHK